MSIIHKKMTKVNNVDNLKDQKRRRDHPFEKNFVTSGGWGSHARVFRYNKMYSKRK